MNTTLASVEENPLSRLSPELQEKVFAVGDLSVLSASERNLYYCALCDYIGVSPLAKPFEYLELDKKLVLYPNKSLAEQLRRMGKLSITSIERKYEGDLYVVIVKGLLPGGRSDEALYAIPMVKEGGEWTTTQGPNPKRYFKSNGVMQPLSPQDKANALKKAETGAKRRLTLSMFGLGFLVPETADVEDAYHVDVDPATGEILGDPPGSVRTTDKYGRATVLHKAEEPLAVIDFEDPNLYGEEGGVVVTPTIAAPAAIAPAGEGQTIKEAQAKAKPRERFFAGLHDMGYPPYEEPYKDFYRQTVQRVLGCGLLETLSKLREQDWTKLADWVMAYKEAIPAKKVLKVDSEKMQPLREARNLAKEGMPASAAVEGLAQMAEEKHPGEAIEAGASEASASLDEYDQFADE